MEKTIERTYNVPLRKGFQKAPKYKRAKKAIIVLKEFLARHMKCDLDNIKLGRKLNEKIWERGYKYPPHHIKVTAIKDEKGVKVELFGFKYEEPIVPEKTEEEQKKEDKQTQEKEENEREELEAKKEEKKEEKKKESKEKDQEQKKEKTTEKKEIKTKKKSEKKEPENKEIKKEPEKETSKEKKSKKPKKSEEN